MLLLSQLSDEGLFERIRRGESEAFHELYGRYERKLFAFIYRYVQNRQTAEDVFHEAFLSVLKDTLVDFEQGSFRGWIYCVSRNLCLNKLRSESRERKAKTLFLVSEEILQQDDGQSAMPSPGLLKGVLEKLPPTLFEVYSLRVAGLSYEEMAQSLGVPLGTVKSRMHEMVKTLRKEIEKCSVT